jgi:hypothetical protein
VAALNLCTAHYRRWQRHGSPRADRPITARRSSAPADVERAARLHRDGASIGGIARLLGTTRSAIYTALRQTNSPIRTTPPDIEQPDHNSTDTKQNQQ